MSDFKPTNTKHIIQDMKGQAILASTIMLCIMTGTGFMADTDIKTHALQGMQSSIETLVHETPVLISSAAITLTQYAEHYTTELFTRPFEPMKINNAPVIQMAENVSLHIETQQVTQLSSVSLYQNSLHDFDNTNALNTTTMLGQINSPFASYTKTAQNIYKNQGVKVASLSEIDSLLELKHAQYSYVDNKFFIKNVNAKLPKYKTTFQKAAHKYNLDWRLIASIAYQESVWDPKAVSPTGVKGMMMLTRVTAQEMNVRNRTNATESIFGGTAYFKKILKRIPASVTGADRTLMALAAYNMGYGHLIAARQLTQTQNADASKWSEVKKRIPLLQQKKYYSESKYGYAGGARQALHYVAEIQKHFDMLLMITEKSAIQKGQISKNAITGFAMTRYAQS